MATENNDVLQKIEFLCKQRGWTTYRLAKESGIAYSSITNMFSRNTQPTIYTLEKLCSGLGITISEFFETDEKSEDCSLIVNEFETKIIQTYRRLDAESQRIFFAYLKGLAKLPLNHENLPFEKDE